MKKEIVKILIELYSEYILSTEDERTHELTDLENGGMKKVVFKGDIDGFMAYIQRKYSNPLQ